MSLNGEAKVRSKVQCAIAGAKPIDDPKATEEHRSSEVPGREPPSNGHMSKHDWWGMEIVGNMKGP
jgi:hypothetical protein